MGNGGTSATEDKIIDIYGPLGIRKYITTNLELSRSPLAYKYNVHELIPENDQFPEDWDDWPVDHECNSKKPLELSYRCVNKTLNDKGHRFWNVMEDPEYSVKAVPIKHRIPCFGFVVQEADKPGKLDVAKARLLGVQSGPDMGKLKNGASVIAVGTGQIIEPEDVVGEPIPGRKVVILGDTCDTTEIARFSQYANYIVHEATMENSLQEKAIQYGHSTPKMAADFAIKVKGRKLCLTHVSPRYKPIDSAKPEDSETAAILLAEAKERLYEKDASKIKVVVAEDFLEDQVNIS